MDKISDFFKDLKERISSPLIFSFIVSWPVFNWKIVVGLFFYRIGELERDGFTSYLDFISKNLNATNSFWKPIIVALLYTFAFPFIRNCILAFNSWIKTWGNNWNLRLSKTLTISIAKYMQLREVYESRTALLQELLEKEGRYLKDYETERNKVLEVTNQHNDVLQELKQWKAVNDASQINGEWEIHYPDSDFKQNIYRVRINHHTFEYLDNPPVETKGQTSIRAFYRNPNGSYLTFITAVDGIEQKRSYHFFQLDILDDMNLLRGFEDDRVRIEFRKRR